MIMKGFLLGLWGLIMTGCGSRTDLMIEPFPRSRVIVLTDMLNEADDSQTMVRLLMYANRMDIEGLIAVSSCHQYAGKGDPNPVRNGVHPEEIHAFIDAYSLVFENLQQHESGWPDPQDLHAVVGAGPPEFGMEGVGKGCSTSGSGLIVRALTDHDPRPLYVCINAGASCLAQALFDLKDSLDDSGFRQVTGKLRIYDDAGQDNAGAWIAHHFPWIHYQRSSSQVFSFYGREVPVTWDTTFYPGEGQHVWAREHVQTGHGPLGALYPIRYRWQQPGVYHTLEGGGTTTWIGHINHGLYVPEEITWGGWGGRFDSVLTENILADGQLKWAGLEGAEKPYLPFMMYPQTGDLWTDPGSGLEYQDEGAPVFRWRQAYQNDFEARMDWCVKSYGQANHNPVASVFSDLSNGVARCEAVPGQVISLDASGSTDPDGDNLSFRWFVYPEAGNYPGEVGLRSPSGETAFLAVPEDAQGKEIHVILEVKDDHPLVPMYDYRRVVVNVSDEG